MRSIVIPLLAVMGLGCQAHAQTYVSVGYGGVGCALWSARKPIEGKAYEAWIYGYINSYNAYVFKGPNLIEGMSEEELRKWFDAYCHKSPTASLDSAVHALIEEQVRKNPG